MGTNCDIHPNQNSLIQSRFSLLSTFTSLSSSISQTKQIHDSHPTTHQVAIPPRWYGVKRKADAIVNSTQKKTFRTQFRLYKRWVDLNNKDATTQSVNKSITSSRFLWSRRLKRILSLELHKAMLR